jgi:nucleotide-binding universal stress UspA family protein
MVFKIIKQPKFTTRAKIVIPTDDAPLVQEVVVKFQVVEFVDGMKDADFLRLIVRDMEDLTDEDGKPVAFVDVRDELFAMPFVAVGLSRAYFKSLAEAATKN